MASAISLPFKTLKNALTQGKISITGFSIFAGTWDTNTSAIYRLGVSLPEIAKLLGHEDISTTEIYAETDPEMAAEAISKMLGKQPVRKWDFLTEDEKLKILGLK